MGCLRCLKTGVLQGSPGAPRRQEDLPPAAKICCQRLGVQAILRVEILLGPDRRAQLPGGPDLPETRISQEAPDLPGGIVQRCPTCASSQVVRSRCHSVLERARKWLTIDRLHRCTGCGWRGWGPPTQEPVDAPAFLGADQPPDLGAIDAHLGRVLPRE